MSVQYTLERFQHAQHMLNTGETVEYSACMYDIPLNMFKGWLAGLSIQFVIDNEENNAQTPKVLRGSNSGQTNNGRENNSAKVNETRGHLQGSGGVRGHSAGDIFPYIVVIVGTFSDGFAYHVIGNGVKLGQSTWATYKIAHQEAMLAMMGAP